jgi:hypothetical protein
MSTPSVLDKANRVIEVAKNVANGDTYIGDTVAEVAESLLSSVHVRDAALRYVVDVDKATQQEVFALFSEPEFEAYEDDEKLGAIRIIKAGFGILALPDDHDEAQDAIEKLEEIVDLVESGLELNPEYSLGHLFERMFTLNIPPRVFVDSVRGTTMESIVTAYNETASE